MAERCKLTGYAPVEMVKASDMDAAIQQAVAAQRERDAVIVETFKPYKVYVGIKRHIAAAIRQGGKP